MGFLAFYATNYFAENIRVGKLTTTTKPPNRACSRPAQLPKLGISFDGCRS